MPMMRPRFTQRFTYGVRAAAMLLPLSAAVSACGGAEPEAKAPQAGTEAPSAPAPAAQGQQVGVSSGPASSGNGLTGAAKDSYDCGFQAWISGDLQGARSSFLDAATKAPTAASPKYSLGCVLERLGDTQAALDAYRSAYSNSASFDPAVGAYSVLLARTGHGLDAEQVLNAKIASNPDAVDLKIYLAEVKSIEGDSASCQKTAQDALAQKPDAKEAMVVIARDYYRSHRLDLAKYALGAILDGTDDGSIPPRDADNAEALLLRGLVERESGQRSDGAAAIRDFEKAISKRPDLFEAYINLGEMKLEAGNASEAQGPLEKAVKYAPNTPVVHLDLGECYRMLGRAADAKSELDKALTMDSTLAGVHYNLGLLYLFSPSVPGASTPDDQLARAIQEFEAFKSMRGAKVAKGTGDDVEDLLSTAKRKQGELQVKKQAAAASAAATPAATSNTVSPAPAGGPAK